MKVLFIGNSYTYFNALPEMLADLSVRAGTPVETASVTSPGKSLDWHWYNNATLDAIAEGGWDHVVLQDHSLGAIDDWSVLSRAARRFNERIRAAGASPVLFVTWARQHIPGMQPDIATGYARVAREIGALLAPVGPAWRRALDASPALPLYDDDRSHPSIVGSYFACCVFYATLLQKTPVGLPNQYTLAEGVTAVIDPEMARTVQEHAWAAVQAGDA